MRMRDIAVSMLVAVAACSSGKSESAQSAPAPYANAPRHKESGLPVIPLSVIHAGKVLIFKVEIAGSAEEQAKGLMFRTAMGADEGMIFPKDPPRTASFWMRNTVIPLDIIFIGTDHRILNIAAQTVPYSETPLLSAGRVSAVLELVGGRAEQLGIGKGDLVKW